jgi:hypothetical protein
MYIQIHAFHFDDKINFLCCLMGRFTQRAINNTTFSPKHVLMRNLAFEEIIMEASWQDLCKLIMTIFQI